MANAYQTAMRAQHDGLIDEWAEPTTIVRTIKTKNAQGQIEETDSNIATAELLWIQPNQQFQNQANQSIQMNVNEKTTHLAFQKWTGLNLETNDRVTPNSGPYAGREFDVLNHLIFESHRLTELQLVEKT